MSTPILRLVVGLHLGVVRLVQRTAVAAERGQSTAEYALVLAGIAGLVALVFAKTDVFQSIFTKAVAAVNKAIK
jgi:hypothetical protein